MSPRTTFSDIRLELVLLELFSLLIMQVLEMKARFDDFHPKAMQRRQRPHICDADSQMSASCQFA